MRLSISNIAWDVGDDAMVAAMLRHHGVDAVDVAPTKYFPDPSEATAEAVGRVKAWWADRGVGIVGMQSLLFGTSGLNLFGDAAIRRAMLAHLRQVCRVGAGLAASRLVFGSPRNRDRAGLTDDAAQAIAIGFFRDLGDIAADAGLVVCLEPNPSRYGCNFMLTTDETAAVVSAVDHPAIRLQLDTGALVLAGEAPDRVIAEHAALVGHVHLSEPDLVPLGDGGIDHRPIAAALARHLPGQVAAIEMLAPKGETPMVAVQRALAVAAVTYGPRPAVRATGGGDLDVP